MIYEIPGSATVDRRSIEVEAQETDVPGLLSTESDCKVGWNVTHKKSGFIVCHWPTKEKALKSAGQLGKLPINWELSSREVFMAVAALTNLQIDKFMVARGVPLVKDHKKFREVLWEQLKNPTFPRSGR